MALYVCSIPGCPTISDKSKCPKHRAEERRRRGTTTEQGLGWAHQQQRARLLPAALGKPCPRGCGRIITDANATLEHSQPRSLGNRQLGDVVICAPCNYAGGGRLSRPNN